jgi:arginyl-tRNA--protein-N-Asp/Glu arginylyltransferase
MLLDADFEYINEAFEADKVTPRQLDVLLANGWRHFGAYFFRYNLGLLDFDIRRVIPLRTRLSQFSFSKSQRRVLRRNDDLEVVTCPVEIDDEAEDLFHRHKKRFDHNVPESIFDFLPRDTAGSPCETKQICAYKNNELVAASYFDIGLRTASGVYAIFEPDQANRSLGIFTMLKEIEYAIGAGKEFYYQGYSYEGESFYDYKKRFRGTEMFDWNGDWKKFATEIPEITEDECQN